MPDASTVMEVDPVLGPLVVAVLLKAGWSELTAPKRVDLARLEVATMAMFATCSIDVFTATSLADLHTLACALLPPILPRVVWDKLDPITVMLTEPVLGPLVLKLLLMES